MVTDTEGLRRQISGIPCHVAETRPGDIVAFDWHTWHASINGTGRRQWTISYAKDPRTTQEARRLQDFFQSAVPEGDEPYDHHRDHRSVRDAPYVVTVAIGRVLTRAGCERICSVS